MWAHGVKQCQRQHNNGLANGLLVVKVKGLAVLQVQYLRLSPFNTRARLCARMVRDWHGAERGPSN